LTLPIEEDAFILSAARPRRKKKVRRRIVRQPPEEEDFGMTLQLTVGIQYYLSPGTTEILHQFSEGIEVYKSIKLNYGNHS
ncbi:MAG: hypothetical protein AB1589_10790, partial [Cyanobacteriota bacterium]